MNRVLAAAVILATSSCFAMTAYAQSGGGSAGGGSNGGTKSVKPRPDGTTSVGGGVGTGTGSAPSPMHKKDSMKKGDGAMKDSMMKTPQ